MDLTRLLHDISPQANFVVFMPGAPLLVTVQLTASPSPQPAGNSRARLQTQQKLSGVGCHLVGCLPGATCGAQSALCRLLAAGWHDWLARLHCRHLCLHLRQRH